MDWVTGIQNAINYIENHLTDGIDMEFVAKEAACSEFYFQRIFSILCGITLGDYIRNRRLTLAGNELCVSDTKVIDIAFKYGVLGCNDVYNSFSLGPKITFDTMPFGFENHLIFGSINFRQDHMEKAIGMLAKSRYDEIVGLISREEFTAAPIHAYENRIYCKDAPMKTAVIWNPDYIDTAR